MKRLPKSKDPNTPAAELLRLSYIYPAQIAENPALPLIALEDPDLYRRISHVIDNASTARRLKAALSALIAAKRRPR